MREGQIHDGLMAWLKKNQIYYVHATFGKRSTMTKDAPDFIILVEGKALLLECKTAKGALTAGQKKSFAKIAAQSGMSVQIARSVEEAVSAVWAWIRANTSLHLFEDLSVPVQAEEAIAEANGPEAGGSTTKRPTSTEVVERRPLPPAIDGHSPGAQSLFIAQIAGVNYVCSGDRTPGGTIQRIRKATAGDILHMD